LGASYGARDLQTFGPFQCHVARAVLCIPFLFLYLVKTRWHHGFLDPTKTRFFFLGAKLAGKVPVGLLLPQLRSRSGTEAYHRRISRTRCRPRRLRRSLNPGLCLVLMLIIYHLTIYANTRPLLREATPLQYCPLTDVWDWAYALVT